MPSESREHFLLFFGLCGWTAILVVWVVGGLVQSGWLLSRPAWIVGGAAGLVLFMPPALYLAALAFVTRGREG